MPAKKSYSTATCACNRCFNEAVKGMDMTIVTGYRGQVEQIKPIKQPIIAPFPPWQAHSLPSMAVDACPYPYDWEKTSRTSNFGGSHQENGWGLGMRLGMG